MSRSRNHVFPVLGRYRTSQNRPLTTKPNGRTDLPPPPSTPVSQAAHLLLSHAIEGSPALPLIDHRAFAQLVKVAKRSGLVETDAQGRPVNADRFFEELEPYRPFFAKGSGDPLPAFRVLVERNRAQARDAFVSAAASPHDA
ncbi:MAG: hypothetical protein ACKVPX_15015 [Myxococcaceae bacterium]